MKVAVLVRPLFCIFKLSMGIGCFVVAVLGVGGEGFYFKIYKPKKELESSDDLDDFTFAEDEDDFLGDENLEDVQDNGNEVVIEE